MFKSEAALKAAQTLSDQITAVKTQLRTLQDKCGGDQLVIEGDCKNVGDLEKEVIELASETEVLKKSAPEGNDESNIQYFLAIAELEKTNKILRQQEIITNDNLKSLDLDIEGTRNDLEELKKLKEMKPASVTEKNKENVGSSDKLSEVENKVRGTRKLFKEFKSFLTDYLKQIDPVVSGENGGHLGHLLQVMWTSFQGCINDNIPATSEESYIKMSFLDFDVEEDHINLLVKNGIAELHPEQKDLIRLVNFVD